MNAGFFTRVVVLAGLVQLATSELTIEGRAGDLLAAEARQGAQGPWTQMHVHNLYALQSEETREELGLTKKQKRQIDELLAEYNSAWQDYLAENRDGQRETGRKAFDELTDQQKAALKGLDSIERMWFNTVQWPGIGEQIGLDDVQKKKIDAVMADHNQKRIQAFQSVQTRLTPEMVEKSREVQQRYQQMVEDAKEAVRDVLSEKQFDALVAHIAKVQWPYLFRQDRFVKEMALSEGQAEWFDKYLKERGDLLRKLNETGDPKERLAAAQAMREETAEKAIAMLTDEQKARLKELPAISVMWFNAVQWPGMGEKIGLDDVQRKKIDAIIAAHHQERTQAFQSVQTRSTPEMVEKSRKVQRQYQEMVEDAKKAVRGVLSDKQFDALITEIAVMQLPGLVRQKRFPEDLALTEAQIARIETMQQATDANLRQRATKAWETRRQLEEKLQQVLTPKQKAQLDEKARDRMTPRSLPR